MHGSLEGTDVNFLDAQDSTEKRRDDLLKEWRHERGVPGYQTQGACEGTV